MELPLFFVCRKGQNGRDRQDRTSCRDSCRWQQSTACFAVAWSLALLTRDARGRRKRVDVAPEAWSEKSNREKGRAMCHGSIAQLRTSRDKRRERDPRLWSFGGHCLVPRVLAAAAVNSISLSSSSYVRLHIWSLADAFLL